MLLLRSMIKGATILLIPVLTIILLSTGCDPVYTPRPKGYFRIDFPEKKYETYAHEACGFLFEYPSYASISRDSLLFGQPVEDPCWLNILFPGFGGTIYLSHKLIDAEEGLAKLIEDAHTLTFKHTVKADYINETVIHTPHQYGGLIYEVGGNAASSVQFYITDSTEHFLRGALYFKATPNADSLAPVIDFVKEDMWKLINTFSWNKEN